MLPRSRSPHPTQRDGRETAIDFTNRTGAAAQLYWLDTDGGRQSYGWLADGVTTRQHTYGGHRWLVCDASGTPLGVYEADEVPARVELTVDDRYTLVVPLAELPGPGAMSPDGTMRFEVTCKRVACRKLRIPGGREIDYAKPGDPIDELTPRLFHGQRELAIDNALFPTPWEITHVRWEEDGSRVTFIYNERGHQRVRLIAIDAQSAEASCLVEERSDTVIDYPDKLWCQFIGDGILWMSERSGTNHLYLFDAKTGVLKTRVTKGDLCVRRVEHVDEQRREITFIAAGLRRGEDPYHEHLCRVRFDGTGMTQLTEADAHHDIVFTQDRERFVDTWSRIDLPPVVELRRAADGSLIEELERAEHSALRPPERFVAKGRDGVTDIHGILVLPEHFDPTRRYPIVEEIYAGPSDHHVPTSFTPLAPQRALADEGFIIVMIDGMGTNGRSKAFHDVAYQNLEDAGFPDRKRWIAAAAATRPWMDLSRVGIYGGSAGGQSAARALIDHHDFYSVAVADCGCHDNRMDKIWWNELWLGWPVGPAYERSSNIAAAERLRGELLLIVGALDDNVDPIATYELAKALERAGKRFELAVLDDAGHGAADTPEGSELRRRFLVRHLLGDRPRR